VENFELKKGDIVRLKSVAWLQDMAYRNVCLYDGKFGYLGQWLTDDVLKLAGTDVTIIDVIVQDRPGGDVRWVEINSDSFDYYTTMIISDLLIAEVVGSTMTDIPAVTEDLPDANANLEIAELMNSDKSSEHTVSAWDTQVSGDHYAKLPIQPMIFSMKNGLNPLQHNIIKYVIRHKDKNGKVDLEKASHCLRLLIELEYPDEQ
jgi:hypothetical protein